jgi:hypothetical protein
MRTYESFFDEFGAALQFRWYFGENGNAFDECITDLSWLALGPPGFVIVIAQPADVLCDTDDGGLAWFIVSLSRASREWAAPVELGEWWDRPAIPFHVVLHCLPGQADSVSTLWREAGAVVAMLDGDTSAMADHPSS